MKGLLYLAILILLFSCQKKEFSKFILKDVSYTYHQLGEGNSPIKGDVISISLMISSHKGDTIHYVPDFPYFFEVGATKVDSIFMFMKPQDSISFDVQRLLLNKYFKFYQLLQSDSGGAVLHVKLNDVYQNRENAEIEEKKLLSIRELKEQELLNILLSTHANDYDTIEGVYRKVIKKTNGTSFAYGDELTINYKGSFIGGYVFDNTFLKPRPPSFIYGKEYQLIDGIHYGLIGMKEGESVKIILPSRRAFGEEGSIAGIVPPYTTVIFEITIIKVIKK